DHAANAVDGEEKTGGEEHGAENGDEPEGRVLAGLDDVEGGETDEDAGDHEGEAEEGGGAAVDGGGALRGIVGQDGRKAGAAAEHALLDGGCGFRGDGESHGWCPRPEGPGQRGKAMGLCERGTL